MSKEITAAICLMVGSIGILFIPLLFDNKVQLLKDDINELIRARQEVTQNLDFALNQYYRSMQSYHTSELLIALNKNDSAIKRQKESLESLQNAAKLMISTSRYCENITPDEENKQKDDISKLANYESIWPYYQNNFQLISKTLNYWFDQMRLRQNEITKIESTRFWFYVGFIILQATGMALGIIILGNK
jgi:hypothetical protein